MSYVGTKLHKEISVEELYTVHYFEYSNTYRYPGESHDFWECVYVDRGEVVITAGEEELCLSRGEILFHAPNEWHTLRANG
ncbi:MAG: AraC family ligand binding domain-containing protein, partial [Clostridia bacterium]|nr:AraC family ligand binding domain-containing protein [Clostridia bacterium]